MGLSVGGNRESYENSTKLRRFNLAKYPGVTGASESLLEYMKLVKGLFPQRPSDVQKLRHHVRFFVVNLYHTYLQDPSRWVSCSRNKNKFGKGAKYKTKFKLSHEYSVNKVIKFLLEHQFIEQSPFIHHTDPTKSRQSRIRATQKLIDLIRRQEQEPPPEDSLPEGEEPENGDDGDDDYEGQETIVVKGLKPPPRHVTRVVDGVKTRIKIKPRRKVCQTPDNPLVRKMRENLQKINSLMEKTQITLDIGKRELKKLNARLRGNKDSGTRVIDFTRKRLYRVFLDRRLDRGGRFYGPWYQGIPEEYRSKILINGNPTLEIDYSGYHPRILYALKGLTLPEDPYNLEDFPQTEEMRGFLKGMLLSIVNAKDEKDAIAGMRGQRYKDFKKAKRWGTEIKPLGIEPLTDERYREVMGKLMQRHQPIQEFFYTEKGSYLQWLDSQIAEAIMLYFAEYFDQPCLPVHDSFIVDVRFSSFLRDIMHSYFEQALQQKITVKSDFTEIFKRWDTVVKLGNKEVERFKEAILRDLKDPSKHAKIRAWEAEAEKLLEKMKQGEGQPD